MFPQLIEEKFGLEFSQRAQQIFYDMSVVEDAMTAVSVGVRERGVSAMHDATECGVWGGLFELAQAANLGIRLEKERIVVEDCVEDICKLFGIDPYASISEGTLIIACREYKAEEIVEALSEKDNDAFTYLGANGGDIDEGGKQRPSSAFGMAEISTYSAFGSKS
jgi:hydrogenase maturation factor